MALRRNVLLLAELSLVALSVIATISLERLFTNTSFLRDVLILVVGFIYEWKKGALEWD